MFEHLNRRLAPYRPDPRVNQERRPPPNFTRELRKIDRSLRVEWWNRLPGEERGAGTWRILRFLGPHYWKHVTWSERLDHDLLQALKETDTQRLKSEVGSKDWQHELGEQTRREMRAQEKATEEAEDKHIEDMHEHAKIDLERGPRTHSIAGMKPGEGYGETK